MANGKRHPFDFETPLKLFVRDHICAPNHWDPLQTRLEIPLNGRRSIVRLVTGPEGQRFVLRVFPTKESIREAKRIQKINDMLEANSVPTPRHLRRVSNFGGRKAILLEEEHIEGDNLLASPRTPETLHAIASTLARLHSVRSPHHGDPFAPRTGGFAGRVLKRYKNRLRGLRARVPNRPTKAERCEVMAWARSWRPALERLPLHSLIHDKLNPHNMIVSPEPRALLLDITTVQWGHPAKDMAQLRLESFAEDEAAWQMLLAQYQDLVGSDIAAEVRDFLPLFEVYFLVGEAAIAAKRLLRVQRGRSTAVVKKAPVKIERHWQRALDIVRETAPMEP